MQGVKYKDVEGEIEQKGESTGIAAEFWLLPNILSQTAAACDHRIRGTDKVLVKSREVLVTYEVFIHPTHVS